MLAPHMPEAIGRALSARGYAELTPVQSAVADPQANGRDLLVSARTGSGKTVAYGLAMAADLIGEDATPERAGAPLALVVAPTRELALQVARELEWLYADLGAQVTVCVGGAEPRREQRALRAGVHVVVGTPGRLRDHLARGALDLSCLRAVVLDEADEMLDLGFREELEALLDATPPQRRTLLFSATLPKPILALARRYQTDALRLSVGDGGGHADIEHRAVLVQPRDVEGAVVNLLRFHEAASTLVFCSTREAVRRLHGRLLERGFSVVALSGELTQAERTHALQALRDRRARVCVATDVAARGIDIPDLELVIHAEPPTDAQALQHRSGRTGRAGRKGVSAFVVPAPKRRRVEALLREAAVEAHWGPPPSAADVRERDQARLIDQLRPAGDAADDDLVVARALLAGATPEEVVAALVGGRRAAMPAPEEVSLAAPPPPATFIADRTTDARPGFEDSAWYAVPLGRRRRAEARWLLPLICRRGDVTKREIGAIRVLEHETRFEIRREAAERFEAAVRASACEGEPDILPVDAADAYDPQRERSRGDTPKRAARPAARGAPRQTGFKRRGAAG